MKYHPNLIIYKVFRRYLTDEEKSEFDNLRMNYKDLRSKHFYNAMLKFFDVEKLRLEPLLWQDIWLYNYINFEVNDKLRRSGLISKYEKEIFIYDDTEFIQFLKKKKNTETR